MFYKIADTLEPSTLEQCMKSHRQFVAVMTSEEWNATKDSFKMGIDLDIEYDRIHTTKAEVNYDSLTGGFTIPDKKDVAELSHEFTFALDEKGVIFIDDDGFAGMIVEDIRLTRRWRNAVYNIRVENPNHVEKGVAAIEVDGAPASYIPPFPEGTHDVRIIMG